MVQQKPFISLAETMLSLGVDLQAKRSRFHRRLTSSFPEVRVTKALARFEQLEFTQVLSELKKQKYKVTLAMQDEWEEYFDGARAECQRITSESDASDREINRMVYALYELSEGEIAILESR